MISAKKSFSIVNICIGISIIIVAVVIFTMIKAYNFTYKARRQEAVRNLEMIYNIQHTYYSKYGNYLASFTELDWEIDKNACYIYFLFNYDNTHNKIQNEIKDYNAISNFAVPVINKNKCFALAISNLDTDPALDVLCILYNGEFKLLHDDTWRKKMVQ